MDQVANGQRKQLAGYQKTTANYNAQKQKLDGLISLETRPTEEPRQPKGHDQQQTHQVVRVAGSRVRQRDNVE